MRNCIIRNNSEHGIGITGEETRGTFEKCRIYDNAFAGIAVTDGADPTVRDCKIYDGKEGGIFVFEKGKGTFENCEVYGNTRSGIEVQTEGNPTVRNCTFRNGKMGCVFIYDHGRGTFIGNTLSDPQNDIWDIRDTAGYVTRQNNRPNQ